MPKKFGRKKGKKFHKKSSKNSDFQKFYEKNIGISAEISPQKIQDPHWQWLIKKQLTDPIFIYS